MQAGPEKKVARGSGLIQVQGIMISKKQAERFWARVDRSGGSDACHEWRGGLKANGYGRMRVGSLPAGTRKMMGTHRIAWILTNGPIVDGLFVCHTCDNPPCCNTRHHFLGTIQDNTADMLAKGRHGSKPGMPIRWSKLTRPLASAMQCLRASAGYTQACLGAMFGVSQAQAGRIIRHEVRYE